MNRSKAAGFWTAPAERSGDGALDRLQRAVEMPNSKEIPNSKLQTAARASSLELLWCFLFGVLSFNWRRDFPSPHSFVAGRGRRNTVEAALVILSSYLRTKKLRRREASELWEP